MAPVRKYCEWASALFALIEAVSDVLTHLYTAKTILMSGVKNVRNIKQVFYRSQHWSLKSKDVITATLCNTVAF